MIEPLTHLHRVATLRFQSAIDRRVHSQKLCWNMVPTAKDSVCGMNVKLAFFSDTKN
jgi:hypothetical protein